MFCIVGRFSSGQHANVQVTLLTTRERELGRTGKTGKTGCCRGIHGYRWRAVYVFGGGGCREVRMVIKTIVKGCWSRRARKVTAWMRVLGLFSSYQALSSRRYGICWAVRIGIPRLIDMWSHSTVTAATTVVQSKCERRLSRATRVLDLF